MSIAGFIVSTGGNGQRAGSPKGGLEQLGRCSSSGSLTGGPAGQAAGWPMWVPSGRVVCQLPSGSRQTR